jgi:outer membrane protein TolC
MHTSGEDRALAIYRETLRRAQDPSASPDPSASASAPSTLTADQAVEIAKRRSARIAAASARAAAIEAVAEEEGQLDNPELRVTNVRLDQLINNVPRVDVGLRVSPPRPGELGAATAVARAEGGVARAEARVEEQEVEAEVRWLFSNVLLLDAEIEAAGTAAAAKKRLHEITKARMDQAVATKVDEAYAELASRESDQDRAEFMADRKSAYGALMARLGLPESAEVHLVGDVFDLSTLPEVPDESALIAAALKARPEIAGAAARIDAADASIYLEKTKRWPWFSFVQVGYQFAPRLQEGLAWSFEAGVELPLLSTNQGGLMLAEAQRTEAEATLKSEVERITHEVRDRLREALVSRELVRAYLASSVPAADRTALEAKAALEAAQVDALQMELIEERRTRVTTRKLKLLRRYHYALWELGAVVGGKVAPARPGARR